MRRPRQVDIAREANVSQASVSAVISGNTSVNLPESTRERILQAAGRLGYVPNRAARSLRTQRTMSVGVIIPDITNPFYPAFVRGVQDALDGEGYEAVTYNTDGLLEREQKSIDTLASGRADGIIASPFRVPLSSWEAPLRHGMPVVLLGNVSRSGRTTALDGVHVNQVDAARAAGHYLISKGHTRICMIACDDGAGRERAQGFCHALRQAGLFGRDSTVSSQTFDEIGGYTAFKRVMERRTKPSAIFAANDLLAMGALSASHEMGLAVPGDVAIFGFDDIPAAALVRPSLSTIAQHPRDMGRTAASLLLDRLTGKWVGEGRQIEMPYSLVARKSA